MSVKVCIIKYKRNTLWNKTADTIISRLREMDDMEVKELTWEIPLFWHICIRIVHCLMFNNKIDGQNHLYHIFGPKALAKAIRRAGMEDADVFLSVCHLTIPDMQLRGRQMLYIDAELCDMIPYIESSGRFFKDWFIRTYTRNKKVDLQSIGKIMTQNEWTRTSMINRYGIEESKIVNVGFGVNLKPFEGEKDYSTHRLLIVLRKGVEHKKGLDLLLPAFRIARKKITDLHLDVVGTDGNEEEGVTYHYNKSREVTEALFRKSSLYVMPAISEPNGVTYLEALANKSPIVGLNRFAMPEFSGNGAWGWCVDNDTPQALADTLVDALSDHERLKQMGEAGQTFVKQRYTWDKVISLLEREIKN